MKALALYLILGVSFHEAGAADDNSFVSRVPVFYEFDEDEATNTTISIATAVSTINITYSNSSSAHNYTDNANVTISSSVQNTTDNSTVVIGATDNSTVVIGSIDIVANITSANSTMNMTTVIGSMADTASTRTTTTNTSTTTTTNTSTTTVTTTTNTSTTTTTTTSTTTTTTTTTSTSTTSSTTTTTTTTTTTSSTTTTTTSTTSTTTTTTTTTNTTTTTTTSTTTTTNTTTSTSTTTTSTVTTSTTNTSTLTFTTTSRSRHFCSGKAVEDWATDNDTSCTDLMSDSQQCTAICGSEYSTIGTYLCSSGVMIGLSVCADLESVTIWKGIPVIAGTCMLELFASSEDAAQSSVDENLQLALATSLAHALSLTLPHVLQIGSTATLFHTEDVEMLALNVDYQIAVVDNASLAFALASASDIVLAESDAHAMFASTLWESISMNISTMIHVIHPRTIYSDLAVTLSGDILGSFGAGKGGGVWPTTTTSRPPVDDSSYREELPEDSPHAAAITVGVVAAVVHTLCLAAAVIYFCRTVDNGKSHGDGEQELSQPGLSSRPGVRPRAAVRLASQRKPKAVR